MSRSSPTENSVECGWHDMGAIEGGRLDVGMPWGNVSQSGEIFEIAPKSQAQGDLCTCAMLRFTTEMLSAPS